MLQMKEVIKKAICIIFLLVIWKNPALRGEDFCSVDSYGYHPFWAQQYTGADLLRKKLAQLQDFTVPEHLFQIWDSDRNLHGEYVSQLIAGPYPSATIPLEKHPDYTILRELTKKSEQHDSFMGCLEQETCPSYINISMIFPSASKEVSNIINLIDRAKTTVVFAAGNDDALVIPVERWYARKQGIVSVGNCGVDGNPYYNTSYAPEIAVCAPSGGNHVRSYDFAGNPEEFGGTSGAAPQVTAALAAFTAITNYSLPPYEAVYLLKKTAIPHPRLPGNSNMGAGMVNTWKIGEVAFKLKKLCGKDDSCYARNLFKEDTFIFSVDRKELLKRASNLAPLCPSNRDKEESSLEKEKLLEDLRKAALLDPYDEQLWSLIGCSNLNKCLLKQAEYYSSLAIRVQKSDRELVDEILRNEDFLFANKYLLLSDNKITEEILTGMKKLSAAQDLDSFVLKELVGIVIQISPEDIPDYNGILHMIVRSSSTQGEDLKELAKGIIKNMDNVSEPYKLLEMIIDHPTIESYSLGRVAYNIIDDAETIPEHHKLLEKILSNPQIEHYELESIGYQIAIEWKIFSDHHKLLEMIVNHPNIESYTLRKIGYSIVYNAESISVHDRILTMIINHPKITSEALELMGYFIAINEEAISNRYRLLEMITGHQKMESDYLGSIGHSIAINGGNISEHDNLLEMIIGHPEIENHALGVIGIGIAENAENISTHHKLLEMIIEHPKIDNDAFKKTTYKSVIRSRLTTDGARPAINIDIEIMKIYEKLNFTGLGGSIVVNAKNIPQHQVLLKKIINHQKVEPLALTNIAWETVLNAENVPGYYELLEMIIYHPKTERNKFQWIGPTIAKGAENIPEHPQFIEEIINHPKIASVSLRKMGSSIAINAKNIPQHQKFMEAIIQHPKTEDRALQLIGASITTNAEDIPQHQKLLEKIINHPKTEPFAFLYIAQGMVANAENISAHHDLLTMIINHPKIKIDDLEILEGSITYYEKDISNPQKLLEMIANKIKVRDATAPTGYNRKLRLIISK